MRYFLQRVSALVVLAFIAFHVFTFRFQGLYDHARPFASTAAAICRFWRSGGARHPLNLMVMGLYLAGLLAFAYHLANGLWTGAIAWERCSSPAAKRCWGWVCAAIGAGLGFCGALAWVAFVFSQFFR
jgi:succinate dehydrogenase / fumarate reductase cytochrome b subunit